jgi:predicted ABC-type ATPase
MKANVYIIAGPNGAGKTTFATSFLPNYAPCTQFVNADLIAKGVAPFAPDTAAIRAGRIMLEEIERLAKLGEDFGIETTLSGKTLLHVIRELKERGYTVHLFFLRLSTADLALSRIEARVRLGGHGVPAWIVHRRFKRSVYNFFRYYRELADFWMLIDNSGDAPMTIASKTEVGLAIIQQDAYTNLLKECGLA